MRAHPPWKSSHPAQDQPAIERRGNRAARVLNVADTLEKIVRGFCYEDPTENVAVAAEVFGR